MWRRSRHPLPVRMRERQPSEEGSRTFRLAPHRAVHHVGVAEQDPHDLGADVRLRVVLDQAEQAIRRRAAATRGSRGRAGRSSVVRPVSMTAASSNASGRSCASRRFSAGKFRIELSSEIVPLSLSTAIASRLQLHVVGEAERLDGLDERVAASRRPARCGFACAGASRRPCACRGARRPRSASRRAPRSARRRRSPRGAR